MPSKVTLEGRLSLERSMGLPSNIVLKFENGGWLDGCKMA